MERVLREIIITAADIRIFQFILSQIQRPDVVFRVILVINDELYAILISQVIELLLLISKNNRDITDPGFLQLLDLPFNKPLPLHFIEPLWLFQ